MPSAMQQPGVAGHWSGMESNRGEITMHSPDTHATAVAHGGYDMLVAIADAPPFHDQVIAILPKLRIQALALTRNRTAAEDLVQDAVCNALSAQNSFILGTNFPAWMHRILRNRFISNLRKRRDTTDIDDVPAHTFATPAAHEDRLALKELGKAMTKLPADQREALLMVVIHGMSYEALAEATGCAVGTAKSRVFRARRQLEAWLMGETKTKAPAVNAAAVALLRDRSRSARDAYGDSRTAQL